jgi:hypothetical protein
MAVSLLKDGLTALEDTFLDKINRNPQRRQRNICLQLDLKKPAMLFNCKQKNDHHRCKKRNAMINLLQNPVFKKQSRVLFFSQQYIPVIHHN